MLWVPGVSSDREQLSLVSKTPSVRFITHLQPSGSLRALISVPCSTRAIHRHHVPSHSRSSFITVTVLWHRHAIVIVMNHLVGMLDDSPPYPTLPTPEVHHRYRSVASRQHLAIVLGSSITSLACSFFQHLFTTDPSTPPSRRRTWVINRLTGSFVISASSLLSEISSRPFATRSFPTQSLIIDSSPHTALARYLITAHVQTVN
jgi:hypothetical protein